MQDSILDDNNALAILRTKDLIFAEIIILSTLFITLIWSIFYSEIPLIGIIPFLIGPAIYTLLWRYRSIKYDTSNPKQDLQSGMTIIFFIWSFLQCMIALPSALSLFLESISQDFSLIKIFHIIPLLTTAIFIFYMIKSFALSIKVDAKKPSIKN
jgi:hypothetical protein